MQLDLSARELTLKLVYYGPSQSGKTTNLRAIHWLSAPRARGALMTLGSPNHRTLLFDLLSLTIAGAGTCRLRLQLVGVPGLVTHEATRRLLLRGADGVVFVADARRSAQDDNRRSLASLAENLRTLNRDPAELAMVVQHNKIDLGEDVEHAIDGVWSRRHRATSLRATALRGHGVVDSLVGVVRQTLTRLERELEDRIALDVEALVAATEANFRSAEKAEAG